MSHHKPLYSLRIADASSKQPWSFYALNLSTFNPPALVTDSFLGYLVWRSFVSTSSEKSIIAPFTALMVFVFWLLFTKVVKLIPHFGRYPQDMRFIPALIIFGYFHGLIKVYALMTLYRVSCPKKKLEYFPANNICQTSWSGSQHLIAQTLSRKNGEQCKTLPIISNDTFLRGRAIEYSNL